MNKFNQTYFFSNIQFSYTACRKCLDQNNQIRRIIFELIECVSVCEKWPGIEFIILVILHYLHAITMCSTFEQYQVQHRVMILFLNKTSKHRSFILKMCITMCLCDVVRSKCVIPIPRHMNISFHIQYHHT